MAVAGATCPSSITANAIVKVRFSIPALLLAAALAACGRATALPPAAAPLPPQPVRLNETPVCYSCFWDWQPAGFRAEYVEVMRQRRFADSLLAADARFTVARVAGDSAGVCAAADAFAALAPVETHPIRHLLALETVAFTAAECGRPTAPPFRAAAAAARAAGERAKADVYEALAAGTFRPLWQLTPVARHLVAPRGTQEFVLGASAIRVDSATRIVSQMERVARDWLSYQLRYDFQHPPAADPVLNYHEGARLRDVTAVTGALPDPATGTIMVQIGARWLAPDSAGVFRFEVLPDKVQYPTTRSWRGVALLVDTHGISSLVDAAQRAGADLVVGCGDYPDKMQAAAYLAARGIDVYFPTDRFVGDVLGYQGSGTLIGSAPVRREGRTAVIGDRPVPFRVAETIVVEGSSQRGEVQYYDAPRRYLLRLAETLPLRLEHVHVDAPGQAERVIARARELGAQAVALKVGNDADAAPVRAWLAESRAHRAVLFHSAAYPAGDQLFTDFPGQTTFGDPRPVFR